MSEPMEAAEHPWYHARVLELENEGCCTSDAQGVADAEYENELRGLRQANKTLRAQRDRLREVCKATWEALDQWASEREPTLEEIAVLRDQARAALKETA